MRTYLRAEWKKYEERILQGTISLEDAQYNFCFDFGSHEKVFKFDEDRLTLNRAPLSQIRGCKLLAMFVGKRHSHPR